MRQDPATQRTPLREASLAARSRSKPARMWPWYALLVALSFTVAFWLDLVTATPRATAVVPAQSDANARIVMPPVGLTGRISGHVLSIGSASGAIAGARVCAVNANYHAFESPAVPCTLTDTNGAYAFDSLQAGAYRLRAAARGYFPGVANGGAALQLEAARVVDEVDIALLAGGSKVTGSVTDASGGPVPRATVRTANLHSAAMVDVECDDDGRFETWTDAGNVALTASAPGYASLVRTIVAPADDVMLRLAPSGSISGKVIARDTSEPVPGVEVFALEPGTLPHPGTATATSDERGAFRIEGLEQGKYILWAQSERWRGELSDPVELSVSERLVGALVYVTPAVRVVGQVRYDVGGQPCVQGHVALHPEADQSSRGLSASASIAMNGSVVIDGVSPGSYAVDVNCDDARASTEPETIVIANDDLDGLVWKVTRGLGLELHVVDAADKPVAGVDLVLWFPETAQGARLSQSYTSDDNGVARVPTILAPGKYSIEAAHGPRAQQLFIELDERTPIARAVYRLPGAGRLTISAVDKRGKPVDNLTVIASPIAPSDEEPREMISTSAPGLQVMSQRIQALTRRLSQGSLAQPRGAGRYLLAALNPGVYEVRADDGVNPSAIATARGLTQITVGREPVEAVVIFDTGASIRGRVVDAAGGPANDVWVSASAEETAEPLPVDGEVPAHQRVMTDDSGHFELPGLEERARYSVRAEPPSGALGLLRHAAPSEDITIRLPAECTLGGAVIDLSGRPVPPFTVQTTQRDTGQIQAKLFLDQNGHWQLQGVPPGPVRLSVIDDQGRTAQRELDLSEGQSVMDIQLTLTTTEQVTPSE